MIKPACFKVRHTLAEFPAYPCPKCEATLLPVGKNLKCEQSAESAFYQENVDGGPDYYAGVFSLLLRCSVPKCSEAVFCIGTFCLIEEEDPSGVNYVPFLKPEFFSPTIRIFSLPESLPERVEKPLLDSFTLFWSNPSASGNALRVAVEALMDYRGVKKWVKNRKGKDEALNLHSRLDEFGKQNRDAADKLLAIKWIGNSGSHLVGLKSKDMVVAFRLMEYVLDELFNKTSQELSGLAKRINKRKKA